MLWGVAGLPPEAQEDQMTIITRGGKDKPIRLGLMLLLLSAGCFAQERDLSQLSIEDLMNVKVTSVSKREQKLGDSAAAIYVISQEDIRHSGMTSIPELLRMVPGLNVAQIDGNLWAVSSRGFNSQFASDLLVLIDGRTVYTPLYSGVYWDVQDLMLEDVDRIEVIRGPGAAVWGANAVNGVINIITKAAQDTQGGLLSTTASTGEQRSAAVRYGGSLGAGRYFRVFGKFLKRDGLAYADGSPSADGWDAARGGFRSDLQISGSDSLTAQGDFYHGNEGQHVTVYALDPMVYSANDGVQVEGGNLLGRWKHVASARSDFSLQAYFDNTQREEYLLSARVSTFDLEFQHHRLLGQRQEMQWGLNYRRVEDVLRGSPTVIFARTQDGTNLFGGFVQDEIGLLSHRLRLILGSKFEHNDCTGFDIQPSARALFVLTSKHRLWAAVSRAVSTPSQAERDSDVTVSSFLTPPGIATLVNFMGNPRLFSEQLLAYEGGYRWEATSRISLDLAGFYDFYHDMDAVVPGSPVMIPVPPHIVIPLDSTNQSHAHTYGGEAAFNLDVTRFWRVSVTNSHLRVSQYSPWSTPAGLGSESPEQQWSLRSNLHLPHHLEADVAGYSVGRLSEQQIPSYTRLDAGLSRSLGERLALSVGGQNLLQGQHPEFRSVLGVTPTEVRRNVFLKATWRF